MVKLEKYDLIENEYALCHLHDFVKEKDRRSIHFDFSYKNFLDEVREYEDFIASFIEREAERRFIGGFEAEVSIKGKHIKYTIRVCWIRRKISLLLKNFILRVLSYEIGEQHNTEINIIRWLGKREVLKILSSHAYAYDAETESPYEDFMKDILLYNRIKRLVGIDLLREDKTFDIYKIIKTIPAVILRDRYIDLSLRSKFPNGVVFIITKGENVLVCSKEFFNKYLSNRLKELTGRDLKNLMVLSKIISSSVSSERVGIIKKSEFILEVLQRKVPRGEFVEYISRLIK